MQRLRSVLKAPHLVYRVLRASQVSLSKYENTGLNSFCVSSYTLSKLSLYGQSTSGARQRSSNCCVGVLLPSPVKPFLTIPMQIAWAWHPDNKIPWSSSAATQSWDSVLGWLRVLFRRLELVSWWSAGACMLRNDSREGKTVVNNNMSSKTVPRWWEKIKDIISVTNIFRMQGRLSHNYSTFDNHLYWIILCLFFY